jgi:type VI secretion system FHA domain protein
VILILEIIAPQPATPGGTTRKTFRQDGGSIGRDNSNSWVLPDPKVSAHHAVISHRNGSFFIEDRSRNGVYLNSSTDRLLGGRPYALNPGDRIRIDPYEIRVSITRDRSEGQRLSELEDLLSPDGRSGESTPFDRSDRGAPRPIHSSGLELAGEPVAGEEVDPLVLLGVATNDPPPRKAPTAKGLDHGSPLEGHYQPPQLVPDPVLPAPASGSAANVITIPQGYNPLADDSTPLSQQVSPAPAPVAPAADRLADGPSLLQPIAPEPVVPRVPSKKEEEVRQPAALSFEQPAFDLATVLEGAGFSSADVTPELARNFGRILRVVVSGVLDVMRSRQQIKDEFRMHMTQFKPAENNPLKFSADVDDALHNLLVKKNPAYLGAVEAFEEAFADLRNHQMAMLAGMRVAFKSMLAEFDADRLQKEFDGRPSKGLLPAKLRYWDLYRERSHEIVNDPEASFRKLFGEEFAQAYEEQLQQLKAQERHGGPEPSRPPRRSDR